MFCVLGGTIEVNILLIGLARVVVATGRGCTASRHVIAVMLWDRGIGTHPIGSLLVGWLRGPWGLTTIVHRHSSNGLLMAIDGVGWVWCVEGGGVGMLIWGKLELLMLVMMILVLLGVDTLGFWDRKKRAIHGVSSCEGRRPCGMCFLSVGGGAEFLITVARGRHIVIRAPLLKNDKSNKTVDQCNPTDGPPDNC